MLCFEKLTSFNTFDEATDRSVIGHFIAYVRHVEGAKINEHMFSGNL
jgi:hypothetical protein